METKTDMTVNKIFTDLFSNHSVFTDDQMQLSTATQKRERILIHLFLHQPFQKYVEFKQTARKETRVFLKFMAGTVLGAKSRKIKKQINEQKLSVVVLMNPELEKLVYISVWNFFFFFPE